jgi:hypothetical protein
MNAPEHLSIDVQVRVGENPIGVAGALALADALAVNNSLRTLDIGGCSIGPEGAIAMARVLESNCALQYLIVSRCVCFGISAVRVRGSESDITEQTKCDQNAMGIVSAGFK